MNMTINIWHIWNTAKGGNMQSTYAGANAELTFIEPPESIVCIRSPEPDLKIFEIGPSPEAGHRAFWWDVNKLMDRLNSVDDETAMIATVDIELRIKSIQRRFYRT